MNQTYYAHGKLLLTGEYFILDGAVGLALPTKYGQILTVEPSEQKGIFWKSIDNENKIWFEAAFSDALEMIESTDIEVAKTVQKILSHCNLTAEHTLLTTQLDFPQNWGLGSSSTLISLLAQWTHVDPYELLEKTFGGSGYDIACATANQPITFQRIPNTAGARIIHPAAFHPAFRDQLYFVHLGKKQDSREGIRHYRNLKGDKSDFIEQISTLTGKITAATDLDEFCHYLEVHENLVSTVLGLQKVKEIYFSDFPGTIKSLGAWGGDFVLVASDESPETIRHYFFDKGFPTILSYHQIILT